MWIQNQVSCLKWIQATGDYKSPCVGNWFEVRSARILNTDQGTLTLILKGEVSVRIVLKKNQHLVDRGGSAKIKVLPEQLWVKIETFELSTIQKKTETKELR